MYNPLVIKRFPRWAAPRPHAAASAAPIVIAVLFFTSSLAVARPSRKHAPPAKHSTALTLIEKSGACFNGPLTAVSPKSVTIQPSGGPAVAIARNDLRQAVQNNSILFSARSSWADVEATHLLGRESFVVKLRNGKTMKGTPYRIEDNGLVYKHLVWLKKTYPKSTIVTVDYLRVKPDAYGFDYFTQEAPALLFFYPEFYDQLKGLEGRVPVRLYDANQPEDNKPVTCAQP